MVLQGPTFTFIKLSLLFLYRRLFLVHQKWLRIAWWVNLIYVLLWGLGATVFYLFQCWPVGWYWLRFYKQHDPTYPGDGQCNSTSVQHVALPLIFGLISDVALLFLPLTAISKLHVSRQKKIGLAGIFGVGLLSVPDHLPDCSPKHAPRLLSPLRLEICNADPILTARVSSNSPA